MAYTNSPLVVYKGLSPSHSGQRTHFIDRITPHCVVGHLSAETICACFPAGRDASCCNYGIGTDICKRNGKSKLLWFADKDKSLNYSPKSDEMVLTVHRWFANKSCPGDWMYNRLGDLAAKVTAALDGAAQTPTADTSVWYRVRKAWTDAKSQIGAYHSLENAKKCVDSHSGYRYKVFDDGGKAVYPADSTPLKSIDTVAREIIQAAWGNGTDRKQRLIAAGYDYKTVQGRVNEILNGGAASIKTKSIDTVVREVIQGTWGNGDKRKRRLTAAGYDYAAVQARVNEIVR